MKHKPYKPAKPKPIFTSKPYKPKPDLQQPAKGHLEVEHLPGLESFVIKELQTIGCKNIQQKNKETLSCNYQGDLKKFNTLRKAVAVYYNLSFAIPRPKALLGDEHFRTLGKAIDHILGLHPKRTFKSFRISAAGQESSVFQRLTTQLEKYLGLPYKTDGDVLLVIRPNSSGGWEVLIRLTPRPLSARQWRVCNLAGGLNATLASVMNDLADIKPTDRYLNAMCGSGTLLIEVKNVAQAIGVDISPEALECAHQNLQASKVKAELIEADVTQLPFEKASFEVITADLPWGDKVGSGEKNITLYPAFLTEMARVATSNARLVVLTHEIKLFETLLKTSAWRILEQYQVYHGGHYPKVYVLQKSRVEVSGFGFQ